MKSLRWQVAAGLLAVAVVGGTYFGWLKLADGNRRATFNNHVRSYRDQVTSLISSYERVIDSAQLIVAQGGISQSDWTHYFATVRLQDYPGLNSVSFSQRVRAADRAAYERTHQRIYPDVRKDEYLPVTDLQPITGLERFLGFDTSSIKPNQYKWIELARDTGLNQRTDAYNFTADPSVYGLFEVLPVYDHAKPITNAQQRRDALLGVILANFKVDQLISALSSLPTASKFTDLEIYDHPQPNASKLLDRDTGSSANQKPYHATIEQDFGNRALVLEVSQPASQLGYRPSIWWLLLAIPAVIAAVGLVRWRMRP